MEEQVKQMWDAFSPYNWTLIMSVKSWKREVEYTASVTIWGEYFICLSAKTAQEAVDKLNKQIEAFKELRARGEEKGKD
jgi:hypothetical protein